MSDDYHLTTESPEETEALGRRLAGIVPPGTVLALRGDLAAGKTCLVRGLASGAVRIAPVHSPTFTIVNEYPGEAGALTVVHVDLYRLVTVEEMADLGPSELFDPGDPSRIVVVEWAERAESALPDRRIDITLEHAGGDRRRISIRNHGVLPEGWGRALSLT